MSESKTFTENMSAAMNVYTKMRECTTPWVISGLKTAIKGYLSLAIEDLDAWVPETKPAPQRAVKRVSGARQGKGKRLYDKRKAAGLCVKCGKPARLKDGKRLHTCEACARRESERKAKARAKMKEASNA